MRGIRSIEKRVDEGREWNEGNQNNSDIDDTINANMKVYDDTLYLNIKSEGGTQDESW